MGVAGLAGASLMSGTASAGSAQVGTIGTNSDRVDIFAEDIDVDDTVTTATLNTDDLVIAGNRVEKVATYTQSGTTSSNVTVNFGVPPVVPDEFHFIRFNDVQMQVAGRIAIQFDGDTAPGNENYEYFDESGTKQNNEDEITLYTTTQAFTNFQGKVEFFASSSRPSVSPVAPLAQINGITGFAHFGGYTNSISDPTIQITFTGGLANGNTIELFRTI